MLSYCPAIRMMFVRPSVCTSACLSVCLLWGCIVTTWCTLSRIRVCGCIVQCSGHSDTKACPPALSRLFPVAPEVNDYYLCNLSPIAIIASITFFCIVNYVMQAISSFKFWNMTKYGGTICISVPLFKFLGTIPLCPAWFTPMGMSQHESV